jgi:serine O-acetyltransferase
MSFYGSASARQEEAAPFGGHPWLLQPGYWAIRVYRFGRYTLQYGGLRGKLLHALYFPLYSAVRLVTGIDIPRTVEIGPRLMIHHFGGIIIHPQARIGADCVLRHGVTIGERREGGGVPVIGDNVTFGAYTQVYGPVRVGSGATLAAMAVVLNDVAPGVTVIGAPARPIGQRDA